MESAIRKSRNAFVIDRSIYASVNDQTETRYFVEYIINSVIPKVVAFIVVIEMALSGISSFLFLFIFSEATFASRRKQF